ncbi:hypothetical protein LMG3410_02096 [Achromobacter aegrifaciens]|nr:hypothetical protein [Achromobacter aegrifaciens]CAB3857320.1 hypothetical protein LMG3410_02096 [Achromobacter aegrifaciens]
MPRVRHMGRRSLIPSPYLESPMIKFIEALLDILAPILSVLDRNGKL